MTEHAERHRKAAHELSRELANLRIRGDGTQNDEKAAEGAIAQALADAEAAGKLAGLDEIEERVAVRLGHIKRVLLPGPFKDGEIDSLETLLSEICALMEN
ncbi:MAG TPA: hypothetical protein VFI02_04550 [Armatimonadota bacterium]|nr:hypothetical protein [Armatimonadota bacterium]